MLLERDAELGILEGLVTGLESTGGKVVLVRGEAGIGKSALVKGFAEARAHETHVLIGACDDLFIAQPLGPFWDIARVEPALRGPLEDGDRPHLLEAVLGLLSRPTRPTIVIIEDTHWADEATLDAIRYIGRRIALANGILLLTYRDGDVDYDHPLRGVIGDIPAGDVVRIQLDGLSMDAVTSIVADSGLDPAAVLAATRGNPFLATEMALAADNSVPSSLNDSVMARVHKLSVGAQETLHALAVIPEPIPGRDALMLDGVDESGLRECEQRGLLESSAGVVAFRHELIRQTIESAMTAGERVARHRVVLDNLSEERYPSLLIHCAVEIDDIDRVIDLVPRSARYAAATGSHIQAVADFRQLGPHLARVSPEHLGQLLEDWAREELLADEVSEAIRLNALARSHYRHAGDRSGESHALARAAHYHENAGQRDRAEELAREAIEVLGDDPDGSDLARALEVNAYLQMMSGNVTAVPHLVNRTLEAGGGDIDQAILVRSLNHRGIVENIADYPAGRASLDEARERAEHAGQWYEECRALFNHAWAAAESRDVGVASDYAQRGIASAVRHELPGLEGYARAMYARILDLRGAWGEAADLAREVLDAAAITQMVALPVVGAIDARRGRPSAHESLTRAWELAVGTGEVQRTMPAGIAAAELTWISGQVIVPARDLERAMQAGLDLGFSWSPGRIAAWLWELGKLERSPRGIAEPYRFLIEGRATDAAVILGKLGIPYERALALTHAGEVEQLEAVEALESLGATAVAAKLRRSMRERGLVVPRGKSRATRRHAAGLTARQAEVLELLGEDLSNTQIADRLFLSPRTVESHVAAVLDKLDVATRGEAVSRARSDGIIGDTA